MWIWPDVCRVCTSDAEVAKTVEVMGARQVWYTDGGPPRQSDPARGYERHERFSVTVPQLGGLQLAWATGLGGRELFGELWRFERAVGELFVQSGAVTSDVLLRHVHQGKSTRPIRSTAEPEIAVRQNGRPAEAGEGDLNWSTTEVPAARWRWVHHFDLNAAYLAAASGLSLPQEGYEPGPHGDYGPGGRVPSIPGYWRVALPLPSARSTRAMPPIAANVSMRGAATSAWVTTPTLQLAAQLGPVHVHESLMAVGWCQGLTPWYETLRDARAALRSGPAYEAVKRVYKAGIGRLGSAHRAREDDPLYQPGWRHHVIAEARGRIYRRLSKCAYPPIALQVDGGWWLSQSKSPEVTAEKLGLPLDPLALGHWKCKGSAPARPARDALGARDPISGLRGLTGA